jgi:hypothetical protein
MLAGFGFASAAQFNRFNHRKKVLLGFFARETLALKFKRTQFMTRFEQGCQIFPHNYIPKWGKYQMTKKWLLGK